MVPKSSAPQLVGAWVLADKLDDRSSWNAMLAWVTQVPVELAKNGLSVCDDHIPWYLDLQHTSLTTRSTYDDVVASPVLQLDTLSPQRVQRHAL